ncbi:antirepressor regulating drug resistance predicted signal transduction N-terminal membrane component [Alistipes sp. CAG:831]|nr:antirepressor regulating drug resistance predicted signal transduction N-terminal membrane component [Alistipes sp. CAG:831]
MNIVGYIIEVLISSGLFLALYRWLLAGKVRFRICRAYIVGAMLLAAVIPLLDVPMYSPPPVPAAVERALVLVPEAMPESGIVPGEGAADEIPAAPAATEAIVLKILAAAYILISASSIALIVFNTIKIRRLRREAHLTRIEDWTLAESEKIQTPFSFLRTVYMGFNYSSSERRMILSHEASHVRHRHSYERLALSVLRSILWFNPFLWIAEKDLREVQEWEADRDVLKEGNDLTLYRTAIFKQLFGYNPEISSGLNHSLTKKRFIMMTKTRPGRYATLRLAAALPLITATFLAFGCGIREQTQQTAAPATAAETGISSHNAAPASQDSVLTITISGTGDTHRLTVDGQECRIGDLDKVIEDKLASGKITVAAIEIIGDTEIGILTDVKQSLRLAGLLKVFYISIGDLEGATTKTEVERRLPPAISEVEGLTTAIPITPANREYFHEIKVNSNDLIMMDGYQLALEELPEKAAGIIAEQGIRTDENSFLCIFSIGCDTASSSELYVQIQNALDKAYSTVRDDYSRKKFSKPLNTLSPEELDEVLSAIPKRISEPEQM